MRDVQPNAYREDTGNATLDTKLHHYVIFVQEILPCITSMQCYAYPNWATYAVCII